MTPKKPANVAGLSFVGSDAINGTSATGTCTHASKQPIHLIMSFPHMHTKGTNMKVDLTRANGTRDDIRAAAGSETDDDAHRLAGIGLRVSEAHRCEDAGKQRNT